MHYPICDSHCDVLTALHNKEQYTFFTKLPHFIKIINCAIFTTHQQISKDEILNYNHNLHNLQLTTNTKLLLSIEDLGIIKPKEIKDLSNLNVFCATLTWNDKNIYAGGAYSKAGLTHLGKQALQSLEENNIFIDTAHLNEKSFWNVCKITNKPILNTHCNIFSIHPHPRNLTDKQIEQIVISNGYMGLTLYEKFISNNKISAKDIALQFDYLIKHFGHKNFGLGSDFFGLDNEYLPTNIKSYDDLQNIAFELAILGYNEDVIYDVLFKNFYTFALSNQIIS